MNQLDPVNVAVLAFAALIGSTELAQLAAESAATLATDANASALAALTNHTADADPHTQYLTKSESADALATKVDKVTGKQLSTEDYTSDEKSKLPAGDGAVNVMVSPLRLAVPADALTA